MIERQRDGGSGDGGGGEGDGSATLKATCLTSSIVKNSGVVQQNYFIFSDKKGRDKSSRRDRKRRH